MAHIAYCWKSGEIGFAEVTDDLELPKGVIAFAMGDEVDVFGRCAVRARLGHKDEFLVPGLPELAEDGDAVQILIDWTERAFGDWPVVVWPFVGSLHTQPICDILLETADDMRTAERGDANG